MRANSTPIVSAQEAPHARLREVVLRHLGSDYRRTPGDSGRRAFAAVVERLARAPFVLDAGCGNGAGTFELARRTPAVTVIGVDKSAARLGAGLRRLESGAAPPNALLLRCDLVDFWQLAAQARLRCTAQFILYPNPWPKAEHLMRRWHAHPVLPAMLALGGRIQLRTNWRVYAEEFATALHLCGGDVELSRFVAEPPLTPFERKYALSGHALWRCRSLVDRRQPTAPPRQPAGA
jgi:tRNA (guanine-N7-)-methyltransferase